MRDIRRDLEERIALVKEQLNAEKTAVERRIHELTQAHEHKVKALTADLNAMMHCPAGGAKTIPYQPTGRPTQGCPDETRTARSRSASFAVRDADPKVKQRQTGVLRTASSVGNQGGPPWRQRRRTCGLARRSDSVRETRHHSAITRWNLCPVEHYRSDQAAAVCLASTKPGCLGSGHRRARAFLLGVASLRPWVGLQESRTSRRAVL